mgnify:CR=1 FL=1
MPQSLQRLQERLGRFDSLMDTTLKCHLLVEELIELILGRVIPTEGALDDLQLNFSRKIALARAFSYERDSRVWTLIRALNSVRNALVHSPDGTRDSTVFDKFSAADAPFRDAGESSDVTPFMIVAATSVILGFLDAAARTASLDGDTLRGLRESQKRILKKLEHQ